MSFSNSAMYYDQARRKRAWSMNGATGMQGYAQYLSGHMADGSVDVGAAVGAGTAVFDAESGDTAMRAIAIGVATGVVTFLLNRWLESMFK